MHAFEKELSKKLKLKPDDDEERQEFLVRVVKEVGNLEDDEWNKLSPALQDWLNKATPAVRADKKVPDFPASKDDADDKPTRGGKAKAEPKETKKRNVSESGMSGTMYVRSYLIDNPASSIEEVAQALVKAGYKGPSTVTISTMRSEFRSLTKLLAERNMFKQGVQLGKG